MDKNLQELSQSMSDPDTQLSTLMEMNLLPDSQLCSCGVEMKLLSKKDISDGHRWVCPRKSCRSGASIRTGTIFFGSRIRLSILLQLSYCFAGGVLAKNCSWLLRNEVSYRSILEWYSICRNVMSHALNDISENFKFVGTDLVVGAVEVDESLFGKKAKGGRGTSRQKHLVFAIVERNGTRCILKFILTNSKVVLQSIIDRFVDKSCTVYHDGLASYSTLHNLGYEHKEVKHNVEFVTAEGVHTNTVEGLFGIVKQKIAFMHGLRTRDAYAAHLGEHSYRAFHGANKEPEKFWRIFVDDVRRYGAVAISDKSEAPAGDDLLTVDGNSERSIEF